MALVTTAIQYSLCVCVSTVDCVHSSVCLRIQRTNHMPWHGFAALFKTFVQFFAGAAIVVVAGVAGVLLPHYSPE